MSRPLGRSLQPTHCLSRLVRKHYDDYVTFTVKFLPIRTRYWYYPVYIFWRVTLMKTHDKALFRFVCFYIYSSLIYPFYYVIYSICRVKIYAININRRPQPFYRILNIAYDRQVYYVHPNY